MFKSLRILLVLSPLCFAGCSTGPQQKASHAPVSAATTAGTQRIIDKASLAVEAASSSRAAEILLEDAQKAFANGDNVSARRLARSAAQEAKAAKNTVHVKQAKQALSEVKSYTNLNAQQYVRLRAAENALVNELGAPAEKLLKSLNSQLESSSARYAARNKNKSPQVIGFQQIVNNPFLWPVLMQASYELIQNPSELLKKDTTTKNEKPDQVDKAS